MASSSSVSVPEFKECCPRPPRPHPRPPPPPPRPHPRPPPPPPPPADAGDLFDSEDEGVSDDEDVCFCVPFPWLLQYHRERLGKPDMTETQLWDYFHENLKIPDDDFDINDWTQETSMEDDRCFLETKGRPHPRHHDEELDNLFSRAGKMVESKIIKDRKTGESEGFGFVSFEYEKSMFDAIQLFNGHVLRGHTLTVFESDSRFPPEPKTAPAVMSPPEPKTMMSPLLSPNSGPNSPKMVGKV
ncbi:hypothetical protein RIF29_18675 [Crotalaria pallida]|uniref:RRM domain-containing protein n=1 Tax=Crotalaria pallida TaxID=3830 RepID=A0AAN9IAN4_CROPI